MAITSNPIPEPVQKSSLSVGLQDIAQIPKSGPSNNLAPRLNLISSANDGSGRLFVNDMRGKLYVIDNGNVSEYLDLKAVVGSSFLDRTGQQGFTSFVFDPNFETNGIFYTVNSETKGTQEPDFPVTKPIPNNQGNIIESSHHDVIRQWTVSDPSANTFSGTVSEMLRIEEPYADHNVGEIAFNPNAELGDSDYGMLYIAIADGGSDGFPVGNTDPLDNGQDLSTPLGKILRIDPQGNNSANGQYGIPTDNPFVSDGDPNSLGEIWAYGLRNPHRISWDTGGDGKMLITDIGQFFIEEVNLGIKGANYGWGNREGTFVINDDSQYVLYELPENDAEYGYTYPVAQYDHDVSGLVAIAGGYVYRGTAIPELVGQYVTADFANDGRFFHVGASQLVNGQQTAFKELRLFNGTQETSFSSLLNSSRSDVRFGVDEAGEIYVTNKIDGIVRKLVRSPEATNNAALYISDVSVVEGENLNGEATFTVSLSQASTETIAVEYATTDGVAKAGEDYTAGIGSLTFLPGETSKTVNISLINDNNNEADEFFTVTLNNPQNALLIQPVGTATISDTLVSSVSITLPSGVENLTLTGTENINGIGNAGNNLLTGNSGNNILNGRAGADTMSGGAGNDLYVVGQASDQVIEASNQGTDTVQVTIDDYTLSANAENLTLLGTANLNGTGNSLNNRLLGNTGNNALYGNAGNDTLDGGTGADTMTGGAGNDIYIINDSGDQVIEASSQGTDTVRASISYVLLENTENLILRGTVNLNGTGNQDNNYLFGNAGNNNLSGSNGNDTLLGNDGNDALIGGNGNDVLTGGSGNDSFRFEAKTDARDTINDFSVTDDVIEIRSSGFGGGLSLGVLAAQQFVLGVSAGDANDRFIYQQSTGKFFFDQDGTGGITQIQMATLSNKVSLSFNDIVIV